MSKIEIKKPKYKELAKHLNVTVSAIQQYNKEKRKLMILGLWKLKEINNIKRDQEYMMINEITKKNIRILINMMINSSGKDGLLDFSHYNLMGIIDTLLHHDIISQYTYKRYSRINNNIGGYNKKLISYKGKHK